MSIRPETDSVQYAVIRLGRAVLPEHLSQEDQDVLFDLTNACFDLLHRFPCPDHPQARNELSIDWLDGRITTHTWPCCAFRALLLEFVIRRHRVRMHVSLPQQLQAANPQELQARLLAYIDHLLSADGSSSLPGHDPPA